MAKEEQALELDGPIAVTLEDVYKMFYILVKQNDIQARAQGVKAPCISFDLRAFKNMPKKMCLEFKNRNGQLDVWINQKPKDRKTVKKPSMLYLPNNEIIEP